MHKSSYINAVLQYIEQNIMSEIAIGSVAKRHFISLSQLYRDFYSYTGHSIKQYIRKRRISNACEKIKCSEISLSIIADESGCQTQQAFHKQFKSIVGVTPLEYRQSDTYFYFYPFSVDEISIAVKVGNEIIPECTTTKFYDSCLIGIEDKAIASIKESKGRIFGRNGKQIGNQFCYEVMTENVELSSERKNALHSCQEQYSCSFASCVVDYYEQDINEGWNYLYNTWLSKSMFEQSDVGYFEEYLFKNGKPYRLKLYLPVQKRKSTHHITVKQLSEMSFVIAREKWDNPRGGENAEHKASEKVIAFLQERYPLIIRSTNHFYVCTYENTYECGLECSDTFKLTQDSELEILHIATGQYAVMSDDCFGDIHVGGDKIDLWLTNNSIAHENEPVFAVYETLNGKYDADNIIMKLYKRIKMTKTDNSNAKNSIKIQPL
ncbi:MAG: hypothetical protein A2Y17_04895 [Clostridiales bacterium GWF2_38_85]|nr:MAG: hypothetical protein A2Y17_04895 [Clostridiales bacterium GWF2_38_85]HBL84375.1 hypothetical protein [Clostridiales bacterium]